MPSDRREAPLVFQTPEGALSGFLWHPARGAPEGPELLFLPGNGFPVQAYRPALAGLPAASVLHALNPRGHGASWLPARDGDLGLGPLYADAKAYLASQLRAPAILVGHSMGSMLALRLAAELPQRVAGLLMMEPPLRIRRGQSASAETRAIIDTFIERARYRRDGWTGLEVAAAWFARSVGYKRWSAAVREAFLHDGLRHLPSGAYELATPPWLEAALYQAMERENLYALAQRVSCAAVLLRGQHSLAVLGAALEDLADALPVAAVVSVPGTHTFAMEQPRETGLRLAEGLRLLRGETGYVATESAPARTE